RHLRSVPLAVRRAEARRDCGAQRIAVTGADRLARDLLPFACDVGNDLRPQAPPRAATDREDSPRLPSGVGHDLKVVANRVGSRLEQAPIDVADVVAEG